MEISGLDPKITICKIDVLPVKLYPLSLNYNTNYPRNDLNVYGNKPAKLKFALSTYSSTRTILIYKYKYYYKARMI